MMWTSNICRICARISDVCIPIFQEDASAAVEAKFRRCLSSSVSKDDLKPKQICRDCFIKLNEFYNFVALFHESNYRFETLLYQSTQNTTGALPSQECGDRAVDIDLSIVAGSDNTLIESKPEDLSDCANLDLIAEYKDAMLPLENLDVQARDFGEQTILNDIVEQATVNNQVDIDMQNFVSANHIYAEINGGAAPQNLTILRNSHDHNYLGKLRSLQTYLDAQNTQIDLVNGPEFKSSGAENHNIPKNEVYIQNFTENVLSNESKSLKSGTIKKRNSKLNVISVDAVRKALENEKLLKYEMSQKIRVNKTKRLISNNLVGKVKPEGLHFVEQNILNAIDGQVVDIDNIEVQKLVAGNESQIYAGVTSDNLTILRNSSDHNLNKIDDIHYLDLEQNLAGKTEDDKSNLKNCQDPLALEYCSYAETCYAQSVLNGCNDTKIKNAKKRSKIKIISVKNICKMNADIKPPPEALSPRKFKINKSKELIDTKFELVPIKPRLNRNRNKESSENLDLIKKQFTCNKCDKTFARRQYFNEHLKKHNSLRPYVCEVCDKPFAIQWDLTFHKRIHTDLYSCEHCSKCFSAPSKLQRHIRTHTGERPFVCLVKDCGRSFSDKRNLSGHQITHTNIRKFTCDVCKRSYKTKSQLKDHMQAHSESPAFKCDKCDKSYRWKTNLLIHLKKHADISKRLIVPKIKKECKKEDACT